MGTYRQITCKQCGYTVKVKQGPTVHMLGEMMKQEREILDNKSKYPEAAYYLEHDGKIGCAGVYLCAKCKEFRDLDLIYIMKEYYAHSIDSTEEEAVYPFEKPYCSECGAEMKFIFDLEAENLRCPKCGGEIEAPISLWFD